MAIQFILTWTIFHSIVLAIGFGIGLAVGLKIPIIGDTIAMLVVGGLLMFMQYTLLHGEFGVSSDWITYSFAGLILGVGIAFVFILRFDKSLGLAETHVWGLPIALFVLTLLQARVFQNENIDGVDNLYVWPIVSLFALLIAAVILYFINSRYNLAFYLLGDRRPELDKVPSWGLIGFVIGVVYGLITGIYLNLN